MQCKITPVYGNS